MVERINSAYHFATDVSEILEGHLTREVGEANQEALYGMMIPFFKSQKNAHMVMTPREAAEMMLCGAPA